MKTHHFILKEDGNIYVIPEMPEKHQFKYYEHSNTEYTKALLLAQESAILVENQEEVLDQLWRHDNRINNPIPFLFWKENILPFPKDEIYPLECGIEVKSLRGDATIGYYTKCGRYWCDECCNGDRCDDSTHRNRKDCPYCNGSGFRNFNTVALITFSEPKPSEEQVERQEEKKSKFAESNALRDKLIDILEENPGTRALYPILHFIESNYSPAHTDNQEEPTQEEHKIGGIAEEIIYHVLAIAKEPEYSFDNQDDRFQKQKRKVVELLTKNTP